MSKRLLRLLAILCLLAVWLGLIPAAHAQFCVPPPAGLVAWWPANGDASDLLGANNGTLNGGATANVAGEVGTAFKFDGVNGSVQIPNSAALEPTNLTIEAWIRFDSLNSSQNSAPGHQYIVFKQNSRSSSFEGYDLGKHRVGTQGDFFYFMVASASGTEVKVNSTNPVSTNVWYHVAGVRGPDYIQLYVNGQLQGQTNVSFPQDYGHLPLYFGTTGQSSWDGKLAGELDEVSLYNRPLSSDEIQGIYLAGSAGKCESPPTILPSTTDLWDINQGSMVTATSPLGPGSDGRDMFGGNYSTAEPGHTVFADGQPAGFVHYVEWQAPVPVNLSSFALFASGDGPSFNNQREFAQFVLKAKSSPFATNYDLTLYTLVVTNHPYNFVDPVNLALVAANITPVTAQYFRAEFTQYTAGRGYDGPRVYELDGFGTYTPVPPTILTQPTSQVVTAGEDVTFAVTATGAVPISYQWMLNGSNIMATATNATLVLTNVQLADSGNSYAVVVSNAFGMTNSTSATLTVIPPVVPSTNDLWDISQGSVVTATSPLDQGSDGRDMFGGSFTIPPSEPGRTIFKDGEPGGFVHYVEWHTPVPVTVNSFNLFAAGDGVQFNNQREFSKFVLKARSNPFATNYDLTLYTLVITNHPYALLDPINLALVSTTITPVTAQYFRAEFTQYTSGTGYDGPRIVELDGFGSNAWVPPTILTQPTNQTAPAGSNATFAVTVTGTVPLSYQWQENATNIPAAVNATATNTTLVLANVQLSQSGNIYSVVVSNAFGVTNSTIATLTVTPSIIPSTADLWDIHLGSIVTGTSGANAPYSDIRDMFGGTFSQTEPGHTVFADGQPPGFVHYVEWKTIAPVTVSSFNLFAAGDGPAANNQREFAQFVLKAKSSPLATNYDLTLYTLAVTNHPYTLVDPANLALVAANIAPVTAQYFRAEFTQYTSGTVFDGPRVIELDGYGSNALMIVNQPANFTQTVGGAATFTVGAIGTPPISYQWQVNGTNIQASNNPSATNSTLSIAKVQPNLSSNQYSVTVSSADGATNSVNAILTVVPSQIRYVSINSTNPAYPYTSWSTAATNIQDAVDAAVSPDTVLVADGVYQYGGRPALGSAFTNRVIVTNAITVQSVNGPASTVIKGFQDPRSTNGPLAVRCAYLAAYAQLIGFTLTNGATQPFSQVAFDGDGGGVCCPSSKAMLFNCVISGNSAFNAGGGAYNCALIDCTLAGNTCRNRNSGMGGGAASCTLTNCIITNNIAYNGGGAFVSSMTGCVVAGNYGGGEASGPDNPPPTLNNCTIAFNSGGGVFGGMIYTTLRNCLVYSNTGANYGASTLSYCCTTPLPPGPGNITNDPLFVNPAAGDFHLQSNSPCINAGNNAYVTTNIDLDGNPRISGGTVDIGAYEFQNPASIISYAWLQQYNLPTDGSADFLDPDHDGLNNWQEWIAGTNPTNASSVLELLSPVSTTNPPGLVVTWQSAPNVNYFLQRATNLSIQPAFQPLATNLPGQPGTTSFTDTNAPAPGPYFYRVGVQHP